MQCHKITTKRDNSTKGHKATAKRKKTTTERCTTLASNYKETQNDNTKQLQRDK